MSGPNLDHIEAQRAALVLALNDARPSPDWAWQVLNSWDALVEIARAAHKAVGYWNEEDEHSLDSAMLAVDDALSRLKQDTT